MKHFKSEGHIYSSVGAAGKGTMKRKIVLMGMTFSGFVTAAIVFFVVKSLESTGQDTSVMLYTFIPIMVLSMGFSILVIGRTMGQGGVKVDTATGTVSFRKASSMGFGSTKLHRSEIQELVLFMYSYNHGRSEGYRIKLITSKGQFVPTIMSYSDLDTAREAGRELASLLSVSFRENADNYV
ncbi:MAG: hypothetical protein GF388_10645 [Candidatus Aegiribacteria sp.]|nr:hypothetical protein [Candidatus Aegiribacteria sp.]MBD3295474.1 hypothetical protein [Candidatus Fermentibacteria bacterium]